MSFLTGLIGTLTGDKPSEWSNFDYSVYKNYKETSENDWDKAKRMAKGRFNIEFDKLNREQKAQMFLAWAKSFFRTDVFNQEVCLPERFEPFSKYIEEQALSYNGANVYELIEKMCKRKTDEHIQAKKWS